MPLTVIGLLEALNSCSLSWLGSYVMPFVSSKFLAKIVHTQVLGRIYLCSKNVNIWFKYLGMLRNIYVPEQGAHMFVPHQLLNTTYGPEV